MGSDDLFKKKRQRKSARKAGTRLPKTDSYLIVCEGKETEPNYFKGLREKINEKQESQIKIELRGEGRSTISLVKETAEIVKHSPQYYAHVWVVFDKDDNRDFDEAIRLAKETYNYSIAWSNQAIEYWFYLYFDYSDSALHRSIWSRKLDEKLKSYGYTAGYDKTTPEIYTILDSYGSVSKASKSAKRVRACQSHLHSRPSDYDPCTTVDKLVDELMGYLD